MEGGDPIESFTSITGTDEGTAIMYLEMAGMNLETGFGFFVFYFLFFCFLFFLFFFYFFFLIDLLPPAIQLFFGGMGDGGMGGFGGGDSMGGGDSGAGGGEEDWVKVVFDDGNIPDSWREQGLRFVKGGVEEGEKGEALKGWEGLSLPQKKNGPCGALCAFHATLLASLYEQVFSLSLFLERHNLKVIFYLFLFFLFLFLFFFLILETIEKRGRSLRKRHLQHPFNHSPKNCLSNRPFLSNHQILCLVPFPPSLPPPPSLLPLSSYNILPLLSGMERIITQIKNQTFMKLIFEACRTLTFLEGGVVRK